MRRVVITGMGTVNPLGNSVKDTWEGVKAGKCGIAPITHFDTTDFKVKLAAEVKDLDTAEILGAREIKRMDIFTQFACVAAKEAMSDAALDMTAENPDRCGCIVSSGIGGLSTIATEHGKGETKGYKFVSPYFIPMTISNMAAGQIAIEYGLKGICTSVVTACAGSNNAIGEAFHRIRDGYEDVMVCGGAEGVIMPLAMAGFQSMQALSLSTDPGRASIPFDKERNGFVMGEGAGILVIEELDHALSRKAKIYAEVVGYGTNCDAYHITAPREDGSGGAMAMQRAFEDAGMKPCEIQYYNAHGTSTAANDTAETKMIKTVFGEDAKKLHISSTKSEIGHMVGSAGAIEAIMCIKAMEDNFVPPTINLDEPDLEHGCDLDYTPNKGVACEINATASCSLGFGGHNGCIILRKCL